MPKGNLDIRISERFDRMSASERRVARFLQAHPEEVLHSSAAALAARAGTSDATVVRTARSLGFSGLDDMRRALAGDLRRALSPADRIATTLSTLPDSEAILDATLAIHRESFDRLSHDIPVSLFGTAVDLIVGAKRILLFGIGPSSAMAAYFRTQMRRFGRDAACLDHTGLLFADELQTLRRGDLVLAFAYGSLYHELDLLLDEAHRLDLHTILITDSLASEVEGRVDFVLPVARGRAEMFSMHTATLALIEALLVGIAARLPEETLSSLRALDAFRQAVAGAKMDLLRTPRNPVPKDRRARSRRR